MPCNVANNPPAVTLPPYEAIQPAAHDPATMPVEVKPSVASAAGPATTPVAPTAAKQDV